MHRRAAIVAVSLFCALALSGCGAPIFAGLTFAELGTAGSLISTAATGKGLGEHAMDAATGRDCRIIESMVRNDRKLCERNGSPAVKKDWKGLASAKDAPLTVSTVQGSGPEPHDAPGG